MKAIDTNVLVRFLTRDDKTQFEKALCIFQRHEIHIPDTVILECEWVLRYAYEFEPANILKALRKLFGLPNVHLTDATTMAHAIDWCEAGLGFADALHLSLCQKQDHLYTFDEKFINRSRGLGKCAVLEPE